jgi:hypothetical protein
LEDLNASISNVKIKFPICVTKHHTLHDPAVSLMEKETVVPTGQEMGGPQILSRHTGKEKSLLFPCWE